MFRYVSPFATNEAAVAASASHRAEDLPASSSSSSSSSDEDEERDEAQKYNKRKGVEQVATAAVVRTRPAKGSTEVTMVAAEMA